jgi:hypothetical protein
MAMEQDEINRKVQRALLQVIAAVVSLQGVTARIAAYPDRKDDIFRELNETGKALSDALKHVAELVDG